MIIWMAFLFLLGGLSTSILIAIISMFVSDQDVGPVNFMVGIILLCITIVVGIIGILNFFVT